MASLLLRHKTGKPVLVLTFCQPTTEPESPNVLFNLNTAIWSNFPFKAGSKFGPFYDLDISWCLPGTPSNNWNQKYKTMKPVLLILYQTQTLSFQQQSHTFASELADRFFTSCNPQRTTFALSQIHLLIQRFYSVLASVILCTEVGKNPQWKRLWICCLLTVQCWPGWLPPLL